MPKKSEVIASFRKVMNARSVEIETLAKIATVAIKRMSTNAKQDTADLADLETKKDVIDFIFSFAPFDGEKGVLELLLQAVEKKMIAKPVGFDDEEENNEEEEPPRARKSAAAKVSKNKERSSTRDNSIEVRIVFTGDAVKLVNALKLREIDPPGAKPVIVASRNGLFDVVATKKGIEFNNMTLGSLSRATFYIRRRMADKKKLLESAEVILPKGADVPENVLARANVEVTREGLFVSSEGAELGPS